MECALPAAQGDRWGAPPPPLLACRPDQHQLQPALAATHVQCPNTKLCKTCGRDKTCSECAQGYNIDSSKNCKAVGLPAPACSIGAASRWRRCQASGGLCREAESSAPNSPPSPPLLQCTTPQCEYCTANSSRCTTCNYGWYLLLATGTCAPPVGWRAAPTAGRAPRGLIASTAASASSNARTRPARCVRRTTKSASCAPLGHTCSPLAPARPAALTAAPNARPAAAAPAAPGGASACRSALTSAAACATAMPRCARNARRTTTKTQEQAAAPR